MDEQVAPERLAALNPTLRGIRLGNFTCVDKALFLGAARGNHFDIILRDVQSGAGPPGVVAAVQSLQASGFINYFGLQRFGSGSVPTHRWGALHIWCTHCESCALELGASMVVISTDGQPTACCCWQHQPAGVELNFLCEVKPTM